MSAWSDFKILLSNYIPSITKAIHIAGIQLDNTINEINPIMKPLVHEVINNCDWGKKIRWVLALMIYESIQQQIPHSNISDITPLAAAIEIFQTAILIHDDIIDQSDLRRGRKTIHTQLWWHYGVSQAICIGDIGFFLANQLINNLTLDPKVIIRLMNLFSNMVIATGTGEMLDVYVSHNNQATYDEIISIMKYKTARYTIGYPLMLGATAAWADDSILLALQQYGDAVGIAFQIADDILWLYGNSNLLGKPVISDIIENKQTLILRYAKQHANTNQLVRINHLYGKADITSDEVLELKVLFEDIGALEYTRQKKTQYLIEALDILNQLPTWLNNNHLIGLIEMIRMM